MLRFENLSVRLAHRPILRGISATLEKGTFCAILGPNGAGKTTLLRALAGLLPHEGTLALNGTSLATLSPAARARQIGYLPQGHQTHWPLPVHDVVALGRFPHGATDPHALPAADAAIVANAMRLTGVEGLAAEPATSLSGGEKARVALARVLALQAPVLLADEPTASLDPRYQLDVMDMLRSTAHAGALVIAVTHDLDRALAFADRVIVLNEGSIAADGPPATALSPAIIARVFNVIATPNAGIRWEKPQ